MRYSLIALGSLAIAAAVPAPNDYVVHEKRSRPNPFWAKREPLPSDMLLPMRIGLKQRNLDKGAEILMDISSHDSPNYAKHLTAEEVNELFAPAEETVEGVRAWLIEAGIEPHKISQSTNKAWIQFDATTAEAEKLLKTKYHFYEHEQGDANVACDKYHLPSHVQDHVDYITPGIRLLTTGSVSNKAKRDNLERRDQTAKKRGFGGPPTPPKTRPLPAGMEHGPLASGSLAVCDQIATPACIAALYNITKPTKANKNNRLGIFEWGDVYSQNDLNLFYGLFQTQIPNGTHPVLNAVDGAVAPSEALNQSYGGTESALDFQITYPIIYPQQSVLFQTDDPYYTGYTSTVEYNGLFNNFLDAVDGSYCSYTAFGETGNDPTQDPPYPDPNPGGYQGQLQCGVYKPTNVVSFSYGLNEYDLPLAYQQRQCNEWMKLGLQGTTVVFASGDSGVGGRFGQGGHANGCLGNGTVFNPDYPGTCPYMTTAGATYLPRGANVSRDEEVAVASFKSGGGFSNIYAQPSYQRTAVSNYFQKYAPAVVKAYPYYSITENNTIPVGGGIYNRAGRGYPDVSAIGDNVLVVAGNEPALIGGTSAAAPAFAAIINRINEERLAAGKKTVGFINPTIYAHPEVFHDITSGDNVYCQGRGFYASQGWDPVTGLGTPNYPALLKLFMSLP